METKDVICKECGRILTVGDIVVCLYFPLPDNPIGIETPTPDPLDPPKYMNGDYKLPQQCRNIPILWENYEGIDQWTVHECVCIFEEEAPVE